MTILRRVALVVTLAVSTIWDEALLSALVVAAAGLWGAAPAFVAFVVLYGTAGYALSLLVVTAYARRIAGGQSRLERWVAKAYFMDADVCARRCLDGFRRGRTEVVVDHVDPFVVRLPRPVIRRVDDWSLHLLTGTA